MCVEVDHADGALPAVLGDRRQVRVGDGVVAAEDDRDGAGRTDLSDPAAHLRVAFGGVPRHGLGVAVVDHAKLRERVDAEPHVRSQRRHSLRVLAARIAAAVRGPRAVETVSSNGAPRIATSTPASSAGSSTSGGFEKVAIRIGRLVGRLACMVILVEQSRVVGDDAVAAERAHALDAVARVDGPGSTRPPRSCTAVTVSAVTMSCRSVASRARTGHGRRRV